MSERLHLVACSIYAPEITTIIASCAWDNVLFSPVRCMCHMPPSKAKKLFIRAIKSLNLRENDEILVMGWPASLVPSLDEALAKRTHCLESGQCFDLVAPPKLVEFLQAEGAFVVSPGWLRHWRQVFQDWETSQETVRDMFQESCSEVVLLDTLRDHDDVPRLREFGKHLGLPTRILPLGLKLLQAILGQQIHGWREKNCARELDAAYKNASTSRMITEVVKEITQTLDVESIQAKITLLLNMLLDPESVRFLSPDAFDMRTAEQSQKEAASPKYWVESLSGFRIPIIHQGRILYIVECKGISHPCYRQEYAEFFDSFVDVFGLALNNAYTHAALEDYAKEREKLQEKAETASCAKSEFLANMSHELRTPLNGVMGLLQLLQGMELGSDAQDYVDTALVSSRSLLTILNDILDFSKIEAGKVSITNEAFGLESLLKAVVNTFSPQCSKHGVEVTYRLLPNTPGVIVGDMARLRQVLFNLIGNAVKFTTQGSIVIEVQVLEWMSPERMRLGFSISDTGIGIPADQIEYLFEPFTQVDGAHTRKFKGTGLGLSIVKRLINLMEGDVRLESTPGRGTSVFFDISVGAGCQDGDVQAFVPEEDVELEPFSKQAALRVLVAEDNSVSEMVITRFLKRQGHAVANAVNGQLALERLAAEAFDLVIMDVQMPVMDGMETTRRIRAGEAGENATIPIIALTAHALTEDKGKFLEAGMNGYLAKPVEMEVLLREIEKVMGKSAKEAKGQGE